MKSIIQINESRTISIPNFEIGYKTKKTNVKKQDILEDTFVFNFDKNYKLLINSFTDAVDLIHTSIYQAILNGSIEVNENVYNYLIERYHPYEKKIDFLKIKYFKELEKGLKRGKKAVFTIAPTYSCNMRCTYCYQQINSEIDKRLMSSENLDKIFLHILEEVEKYRNEDPDYPVLIELFGGEPIQHKNRTLIQRIFEFARENRFPIIITTNGIEIDRYFDLFATYRGYIKGVNTTLDGVISSHDDRRVIKGATKNGERIIANIDILLKLSIPVVVSMNIDKQNITQIGDMFSLMEQRGWANKDLFRLEIARVDDRLNEINYPYMFKEFELLLELMKIFEKINNIPSNYKIVFLKSTFYLSNLIKIHFNQYEAGRSRYHYCWSTSSLYDGYYIDSSLDAYRCPYSVGRKEFNIGNITSNNVNLNSWMNHNLINRNDCLICKLGGYCSGGCYLTNQIDRKKQCMEELSNFNGFIEEIFIPELKKFVNI